MHSGLGNALGCVSHPCPAVDQWHGRAVLTAGLKRGRTSRREEKVVEEWKWEEREEEKEVENRKWEEGRGSGAGGAAATPPSRRQDRRRRH